MTAQTPPASTPSRRTTRIVRIWRSRFARHLFSNRAAAASLVLVALLVGTALLAPIVTSHDPAAQSLSDQFRGPSGEHLLGTDIYGRDVFTRLVFASRVTLIAILQGLVIASGVGIPLGLIAGYTGGLVDATLSRISDALMSLPPLILAIAIVGILGPGLTNAMVAVGLVLAPPQFRLARGAALSVATETYIEAARTLGASPWRIVRKHVLPNASSPLVVQITFAAGVVVVAEASLSFLGLGAQSPQASWGSMLRDAFDAIYQQPWLVVPPAVMIALTILALSTFGDGLRDALEGRSGNGGERHARWRRRRKSTTETTAALY